MSSRNRKEKEDRIGESQPFQEPPLSVADKARSGRESKPRPNAQADRQATLQAD
jgi:hypothetical protein